MDRSSTHNSARINICLISLEGVNKKWGMQLGFKIMNDEAKYDVVLVGLRLALNVKVTVLQIFSDSHLVVE